MSHIFLEEVVRPLFIKKPSDVEQPDTFTGISQVLNVSQEVALGGGTNELHSASEFCPYLFPGNITVPWICPHQSSYVSFAVWEAVCR